MEKELASVSKTVEHWKKLHEDAQSTAKDTSKFQGLNEQKKKQKEMDLQHNIQVDQIKMEIWSDRQNFLN